MENVFLPWNSFSLEKCVLGAHRGVFHYVLKRELALFEKRVDFSLEICVNMEPMENLLIRAGRDFYDMLMSYRKCNWNVDASAVLNN